MLVTPIHPDFKVLQKLTQIPNNSVKILIGRSIFADCQGFLSVFMPWFLELISVVACFIDRTRKCKCFTANFEATNGYSAALTIFNWN